MGRGGRLRLPRPRHYAWRWWASKAIRVCTGRARCGAPGTSSAPWAQLLQLEVEAGMAVQTEVDGLLVLPVAQAAVRFGAVVAVLMRVQRLHMGGPGRQRLGVALAVAAQAGFLRYRLRLLGRAVSPHALHAFGGVLTAQRAVVVLALLGLQGSDPATARTRSADSPHRRRSLRRGCRSGTDPGWACRRHPGPGAWRRPACPSTGWTRARGGGCRRTAA